MMRRRRGGTYLPVIVIRAPPDVVALAADVRHVCTVVCHATPVVHDHLPPAQPVASLAREEVGGVEQVLDMYYMRQRGMHGAPGGFAGPTLDTQGSLALARESESSARGRQSRTFPGCPRGQALQDSGQPSSVTIDSRERAPHLVSLVCGVQHPICAHEAPHRHVHRPARPLKRRHGPRFLESLRAEDSRNPWP